MGLDMHLYAEKYISGGYSFERESSDPDTRRQVEGFDALLKHPDIAMDQKVYPEADHAYVVVSVAYWRKANAIHSWFVRMCQDGVDECQRTQVSRAKLEELRALCKLILDGTTLGPLEQKTNAWGHSYEERSSVEFSASAQQLIAEQLPPQEGFFFGPTEVGVYYAEDVKSTLEQLTTILDDEGMSHATFYYQSSW